MQDQLQRAIACCASYGVKTKDRHGPMWAGESIKTSMPWYHITHDLAHWMLASHKRRSLVEFGLGAGPETVGEFTQTVSESFRDRDEDCAQILGSLIARSIGNNWIEDLEIPDWIVTDLRFPYKKLMTWYDPELVFSTLKSLMRRGHVSFSGQPQYPPIPVDKVLTKNIKALMARLMEEINER